MECSSTCSSTKELGSFTCYSKFLSLLWPDTVVNKYIQLFQLRLSTSEAEKSNTSAKGCWESLWKFINLLAIPSSLSRSYSTFPLCSEDNLIEIAVYRSVDWGVVIPIMHHYSGTGYESVLWRLDFSITISYPEYARSQVGCWACWIY